MLRTLLTLTCLALPFTLPLAAFAAGSETPAAPAPSETSSCPEGQIWNGTKAACETIKESRLEGEALFEAARELAYVGRHRDVLALLDRMGEQSPRTLTMRGFATRKLGDFETARRHYQAALALDATYHQARSYLGQGYVEVGDSAAARAQLTLIRASGGRGTWAEISLREAIAKGAGYSY